MSYRNSLLFLFTLQNCKRRKHGQTAGTLPICPQKPHAFPDQQDLRDFLDHLSQVCHSRKDGRAVTAIAVRNYRGHPRYVVASTGRVHKPRDGDEDLHKKKLRKFVRNILAMFSCIAEKSIQPADVKLEALKSIVEFNHRRLKSYVESLSKDMRHLANERYENDENGKTIATLFHRGLTDIWGKMIDSDGPILNRNASHSSDSQANKQTVCKELVSLIQLFTADKMVQTQQVVENLNEKVAEGGEALLCRPSIYITCHNIQHAIRRIISYQESVECFAKTALDWPALFHRFTVQLPGANLSMNRKRINRPSIKLDELLGSVFDLQDQEFVSQKLRSDFPGFHSELHKQSAMPCLHSEIALWDYIQSQGKRFVQFTLAKKRVIEKGKIIIGVSKPTCLLCAWYFEELSNQVLIRSTSGNAYLGWTTPWSKTAQSSYRINGMIREKLKQAALAEIRKGWAYHLDQDSAGGTPQAHRQTFDADEVHDELSEHSSQASVSMDMSESSSAVSESTAVTGVSDIRRTYADVAASGLGSVSSQWRLQAAARLRKRASRWPKE